MFSRLIKIIKLNLKNVYSLICIAVGNEWKTTFRVRCIYYQSKINFFELCNALITFQIYINLILMEMLDDFAIAYLDDIIIYFKNMEKHVYYVRAIFKRLQRF